MNRRNLETATEGTNGKMLKLLLKEWIGEILKLLLKERMGKCWNCYWRN